MTPFGRYIALLLSMQPPPLLRTSEGKPCRLNKEQKLALVERWRDTGMSARQFADETGLHPMTFGNWTRGIYLGRHGGVARS